MGNLTLLGSKAPLPSGPASAMIECIAYTGGPISARFTCPEFTSLCPVTGQPDFAAVVIDYVPDTALIESKSLKLFLAAFRNHKGFHEEVTGAVGERLLEAARPHWLRVGAFWYPRGGIPIDVVWQRGRVPEGVFVHMLSSKPYRGR